MTITDISGRFTSDLGAPTPGAAKNSTATSTKERSMHEQLLAQTCEPEEPEQRPPGRAVARCADGNGTMTGLFFSDHVADIARAKAMCALCPLQAGCLAAAIEREEPWGVWGGELLSGGRIVRDKRPCGRPPKQPRPEVVYDEMGPVGIDLVTVG